MASRRVSVFLVVALLSQALSVPVDVLRVPRGFADNELDSKENIAPGPLGHDSIPAASEKRPTRDDDFDDDEGPSKVSLDSTTEKVEYATPVFEDDDSDEDDDFEPMNTAPAGGGSNIFSLLRLANALFPSSSSSGANQGKTPSGEAASPIWTLKMDLLRAFLQFATSLLGKASSSSSSGSTT